MMASILAHFDGKVFVPDEPVTLPTNASVRLMLVPESDGERPLLDLLRATESFADEGSWPTDAAAQHDHYLYGTPKQPS